MADLARKGIPESSQKSCQEIQRAQGRGWQGHDTQGHLQNQHPACATGQAARGTRRRPHRTCKAGSKARSKAAFARSRRLTRGFGPFPTINQSGVGAKRFGRIIFNDRGIDEL